jgi:hypothetical protein
MRPLSWKSLVLALLVLVLLPGERPAGAQPMPARVRVTLQPDCIRPSIGAPCDPRKSNGRLDLGPQIAIWVEGGDGRFVDTVLVTNLTARLGIGNRPGHYTLPSGPKFPYGRRSGVLPVWAHRRGKLYNAVVMQDGLEKEYWLGFHEVVSSPDPYFCRPMTLMEIDVDAVSCPTRTFNSVKGRFFDPATDAMAPHLESDGRPKAYVPPARSYYPPRNDLRTFTENDCDRARAPDCAVSARSYADLNDLDLVSAATPPYGQPFSKSWRVPDSLPDGAYVLYVEVSKEFDLNASHNYPATQDQMLREWGLPNNFGQPSVVYRVPFTFERGGSAQAAVTDIAGYGDWDGKTGALHAPDGTISDSPGSGAGRLLVIEQPRLTATGALAGRVHVVVDNGSGLPPDAGAPPDAADARPMADGGGDAGGDGAVPADAPVGPPACEQAPGAAPIVVTGVTAKAETAEVSFIEPSGELWQRADGYEVRVWNGREQSRAAFAEGLPLREVQKGEPGRVVTVAIADLKSESEYTVGVRPKGDCLEPQVGFASFTTIVREFTQLSGCFIATAAYGSPLASAVDRLRVARDRARDASALAAAAAELYARSSPPVADVLRASGPARAVTRRLLAPFVQLAAAVK